jgi:hypothetical protein
MLNPSWFMENPAAILHVEKGPETIGPDGSYVPQTLHILLEL